MALDEWRRAADWDQVQLTGDGLVRYGKLLGEDRDRPLRGARPVVAFGRGLAARARCG